MPESDGGTRVVIPQELMLSRLAQSEQMREFFVQRFEPRGQTTVLYSKTVVCPRFSFNVGVPDGLIIPARLASPRLSLAMQRPFGTQRQLAQHRAAGCRG